MLKKFNVSEYRQKAEKEFGLESGVYLKVKEGANKIRLLTETMGHSSYYKGNRNVKFVCWILDYVDNKIKLYFMPFTILKAIESLQLSEDYSFEEVPMPYDITINAKNAGTKEVDYQVVPARANTSLSQEVLDELEGKASIKEVIEKLIENDKQNPDKQIPSELSSNNIPIVNEDVEDTSINLKDIPF